MLSGRYLLPDLLATQTLAKRVASHLKKGDCIALQGELGTGKTEFARAVLQNLGVRGDIPSPTFTLVQAYEVKDLLISHFDLYRLKSSDELDELGFEDAAALGVTLIEWPERAGGRLPLRRLSAQFSILADGTRQCVLTPQGGHI